MRLPVAVERQFVLAEAEGGHGPGRREGGVVTPTPGAIKGGGSGVEIHFPQGPTPGFKPLTRGAVTRLQRGKIAAATRTRQDALLQRAFAGGAVVHSDSR